MRIFQRERYRTIIAFITILSISFTQALPAWALRPGIEGRSQGGLEESLRGGTALSASSSTALQAVFSAVGQIEDQEGQLPATTREIVISLLDQLEQTDPTIAAKVGNRAAVLSQMDELLSKAPNETCLTCGTHAVSNVAFSSAERAKPEGLQSDRFNDTEVLTAILIVLDLINSGRVLSLSESDGHQVLANSMLSLRQALNMLEDRLPSQDRKLWTGAEIKQADMERLLKDGYQVVAHLDGDHFVQVTRVEGGRVWYSEPRTAQFDAESQLSIRDFGKRWGRGVVLTNGRIPSSRTTLADSALLNLQGCCGINTVFGQNGGVRSLLDALLRLKYRAPDNTGIAVMTENGIQVVRVGKDVQGHGDGAPDTMVALLYNNPIYPEAVPLAVEWGKKNRAGQQFHTELEKAVKEGIDDFREALKLSNAPRKETLLKSAAGHFARAEQYKEQLTVMAVQQVRDTGKKLLDDEGLPDRRAELKGDASTLRNLFSTGIDAVTVHIGQVGGIWAGDQFLIRHDNLRQLVEKISAAFGLNEEFVRLFLRVELSNVTTERFGENSAQAGAVLEVFDRLSYSAVLGTLTNDQQAEWDQKVMKYLLGRWLKVPSDFNVDAVRHVFRAQASLLGMISPRDENPSLHPEFLSELAKEFDRRMPSRKGQFMAYWKRERDLNQPGHAFAALNEVFHKWAYQYKVDLWDANSKSYKQVQLLDQQQYRVLAGTGQASAATVRLIGELVVGHGRWAMTGDPSRWNAHPHESRDMVLVHNGTINGITNATLKTEHNTNGLAAAYHENGNLEGPEILTDTRIIVTHWQYLQDKAAADLESGRMGEDLIYADESDEGTALGTRLEKKGEGDDAVTGSKTTGRVREWNAIVRNLRSSGRQHISENEVAVRLAMTEMAEGSEIGVSANSLHDPFVTYVVSHDRPVDIVIHEGKVLVTSDMAAGIALFPAADVSRAAQELSRMHRRLQSELEDLRQRRDENDLTPEEYVVEVKQAFAAYKKSANPIKEKFKIDVYHLKELNKFAAIRRVVNSAGEIELSVDISHLDGTPLTEKEWNKEAKFEKAKVDPDVGVKGGYATFIEKHVDEIPSILLDDATSYIEVDDGRPARVHLPDIKTDKLTGRFGPKLERLRRVFLIGVGSSWRDAKIVEQMFGDLLQGVELVQISVQDPVEIQNLGIKLNPETDLAIGMSWSGSTASMVKLFNRLSSGEDQGQDVPLIAVTGKTSSDMASVAKRSAGYVDVQSGPESSVATTKGFESVLYCLCLLGVQLSQMQGNDSLVSARTQYVQELWDLVDQHMDALVREPGKSSGQKERSTAKVENPQERSKVQKVADAWHSRQKVLVIGSRANPVYVEGELKAEEIAWTVGKAADIRDDSWRSLLENSADPHVTESERVATIFNMTDPGTLDQFIKAIREVTDQGIQVVVQTFQKDNSHYAELQRMEQEGRIALFEVPRVRTTLQALVDAIFFFQFSIAFARSHGLTDPQIDNPRNLAKSVTVSGARSLEELVRNSATRVVKVDDITGRLDALQRIYSVYRSGLAARWAELRSARQQAGARLSVLLNGLVREWFGKLAKPNEPQSLWPEASQRDRAERLLARFKQAANADNPTAKVLIVTDEEATQYAGEAAAGVYGSREVVVSGEHKDLYDADKGIKIRAGKWYYRASYDVVAENYTLKFDAKLNPYANPGEQPADAGPIVIVKGQQQVSLNGKQYRVDQGSFLKDPKEKDKLVSGLQMRAEQPDLLLAGVENIRVVRATDPNVDQMVDQDTVVVLVSRARNRGSDNNKDTLLTKPDTRKQLPIPSNAQSEQTMRALADRLAKKAIPLVTIADRDSLLEDPSLDEVRVTHFSLGSDFTSSSVYPSTYVALLAAGVRMGDILGRDVQPVARSLFAVPGMVSNVLGSEQLQKHLEQVLYRVRGYKKVHIIGGGQSYADAKELARVLSTLGIFAEAQLNDSAWHGPLAAADPNRRKYGEPGSDAYKYKYGVNDGYDTDGDTLVVILATDSRFFDSAITDGQVYDSRNARVLFLTSDSNYAPNLPSGDKNPVHRSIIDSGPLQLEELTEAQAKDPSLKNPEGVFTVLDAPDFLSNFGAFAFGIMLADEFSHQNEESLRTRPAEEISRFNLSAESASPAGVPLDSVPLPQPLNSLETFLTTSGGRPLGESNLFNQLSTLSAKQSIQGVMAPYRDRPQQTAVYLAFPYQDPGQAQTVLTGIVSDVANFLKKRDPIIDSFGRSYDGIFYLTLVFDNTVWSAVPGLLQAIQSSVQARAVPGAPVSIDSSAMPGTGVQSSTVFTGLREGVVGGDAAAETAFIAEMNRVLGFEHVSDQGDVANQILEGYRRFHETRTPQVFAVPHPSGEANRFILAAIDENLPHLVNAHVTEPLDRREGLDYATLAGQRIDHVAGLMVMDVQNVLADDIAAIAAKAQKSLRGADAPAAFLAIFDPFEYQLPGSPLKSSVYAEFLLVQEGAKVRTIISDYVPLRGQQNAFSVTFRDDTLSAEALDRDIRAAITRHGLKIATDPAANEMVFSVVYEGVRFMRYIVNSITTVDGKLDERLLTTVEEVDAFVAPSSADSAVVLRDQLVEQAHQEFLADPIQGIHFKAEYDTQTNQTVLVVVSEIGQPNLVAAVSAVVSEAKLDLGRNFGALSDRSGEDVEYFIVPGEVPAATIDQIQNRLSATVTLHFQRAVLEVLPSLNSNEIALHFRDFRSAVENGVAFPTLLAEGTSNPDKQILSFAVRQPSVADMRIQLLQSIVRIFDLNSNGITGNTFFEYDGVMIFHANIAKTALGSPINVVQQQITEVLQPFKAGLEETAGKATEDQRLDVLGASARFLRVLEAGGATVTFSGPLHDNGLVNSLEGAVSVVNAQRLEGGAYTVATYYPGGGTKTSAVLLEQRELPDVQVRDVTSDLNNLRASTAEAVTFTLNQVPVVSSQQAITQGFVFGSSTGLALGVALSRVQDSNGNRLPAAFVVANGDQRAVLERIDGISPESIHATADQAEAWLLEQYPAVTSDAIQDFGITKPVSQTVVQIFEILFGITPDAALQFQLEQLVAQATLAFQA